MKESVEQIIGIVTEDALRALVTTIADNKEGRYFPSAADKVPDELIEICKEEYAKDDSDYDLKRIYPYLNQIEDTILFSDCLSYAENSLYAGDYENFRGYIKFRIGRFLSKASDIDVDAEIYTAVMKGSRCTSHWTFKLFGYERDYMDTDFAMEHVAKELLKFQRDGIYDYFGETIYKYKNRYGIQRATKFALIEIASIPKGMRYEACSYYYEGATVIDLYPEDILSDGTRFVPETFVENLNKQIDFSLPDLPFKNVLIREITNTSRSVNLIYNDELLFVPNDEMGEFERKLERYGSNIIYTTRRHYSNIYHFNRLYHKAESVEERSIYFAIGLFCALNKYFPVYDEDEYNNDEYIYNGTDYKIMLTMMEKYLMSRFPGCRTENWPGYRETTSESSDIILPVGRSAKTKNIDELLDVAVETYRTITDEYTRVFIPVNVGYSKTKKSKSKRK